MAGGQQIAPWRGSNVQMVGQILAELGEHHAYWELFLGGGSVLLAKPPSRAETVVDLHPDLMNLAGVLASPAYDRLACRLELTMASEHLRNAAAAYLDGHGLDAATPCDGLNATEAQQDWAWAFFVVAWMGKGGEAGGKKHPPVSIRYDAAGGAMATRFASAVEAIGALHARLAGVSLYCRDAFAVLGQIEDAPGVVIYADPPFVGKEHLYRFAWASDEGLFGRDKHALLADGLGRFLKTRVVLRYYDVPRLESLYPREVWRRLPCPRTKQSSSARTVAPDLLLVNDGTQRKGAS